MEGSGSKRVENEKGKEEHNLVFGKLKWDVVVGDDDDVMEAMDGCVSVLSVQSCDYERKRKNIRL